VICWHDDSRRCRDHHGGDTLLWYGRCRSGRRWFWAAEEVTGHHGPPSAHGWEDSDDAALRAARAAVGQLAGGRAGTAYLRHGVASRRLKDINTAKRAQQPPPETAGAAAVEYLYGTLHYWPDDGLGTEVREVVPFRITRKTSRRVYYVRHEYGPGDVETGYVDRVVLERDGRVWRRSAGWWADDSELYATREAAEASLGLAGEATRGVPDLRQLRREMADAHPDRGGTNEEFMAARERYQRALRRAS
jgi:hypothetical protein